MHPQLRTRKERHHSFAKFVTICTLELSRGKNEQKRQDFFCLLPFCHTRFPCNMASCSCRKRLMAFFCAPVGPSSQTKHLVARKHQNLICLACIRLKRFFFMFSFFFVLLRLVCLKMAKRSIFFCPFLALYFFPACLQKWKTKRK